jgi:hypothetical protein
MVLALFYFAHGVFLAILSSLLLAPVMPVEIKYSDTNINIYSKFTGFLGACCEYYVTENRLYVFETFKGTIHTERAIDLKNASIKTKGDTLVIHSDKIYKIKVE